MKKRLTVNIVEALAAQASRDQSIWVLDGDLGDSYGLYDELHRPRFDRFIQTGIAEQTLVGAAAGLSSTGKFPWVFSFSAFLCHRAADQIRTCVVQAGLPVVFVGSHAGAATGVNGSSHASISDLGLLGAIGGVELWAPADASDVEAAIGSLLDKPRPAYIRASREPVSGLPLEAGAIRTNGITGDSVLLSTGLASHWASEVVNDLAVRNIPVPWYHIALLENVLLKRWMHSCPSMKRILVLEDHGVVGGLGDAVRRNVSPEMEVRVLCWPADWPGESGSIEELRAAHGLDPRAITRIIESFL